MAQSKLGLKLLGLCAFTLVPMALIAGSAQASGSWALIENEELVLIGGKTLELPALQMAFENHMALLVTTGGGTSIRVLCEQVDLIGVQLELTGALTTGGKAKFLGCSVYLNGSKSVACTPHTGAESGVILTSQFRGLILLHNFKDADGKELALPIVHVHSVEGETLATFELGEEECSVGEQVSVTGVLTVMDCLGEFKVEAGEHLAEAGPLTELFAFGKKATIDGSALVSLAGKHKGWKWGGSPP